MQPCALGRELALELREVGATWAHGGATDDLSMVPPVRVLVVVEDPMVVGARKELRICLPIVSEPGGGPLR